MSSTIENKTKSGSRTRTLTKDEFGQVYEVLQLSTSVRGWIDRGRPERDVDCMEVNNTMNAMRYHVGYQKVCKPLMAKYGIDERELVSRVLHKFAVSAG